MTRSELRYKGPGGQDYTYARSTDVVANLEGKSLSGSGAPITIEDLLMQCAIGRIIAYNILDFIDSSLCKGGVRIAVKQFMSLWRQLHAVEELDQSMAADAAVETYVKQLLDPGALNRHLSLTSAPNFKFLLTNNLPEPPASVSSVMPVAILDGIASKTDLDRWARKSIYIARNSSGPNAPDLVRRLRRLSNVERQFSLAAGRNIGRDQVWGTPMVRFGDEIESRLDDEQADRARDVLGLVHRSRDDLLIALRIPGDVVGAVRSARPSFADAGIHSRFRWRVGPARLRGSWGFTIDLNQFWNGSPDVNGLGERVFEPISGLAFGAVGGKVEFRPLGILGLPRGDHAGVRDVEFAALLSRGRSDGDIVKRLTRL